MSDTVKLAVIILINSTPLVFAEIYLAEGRVSARGCVCLFIKLHITSQSGLVILVILCYSH